MPNWLSYSRAPLIGAVCFAHLALLVVNHFLYQAVSSRPNDTVRSQTLELKITLSNQPLPVKVMLAELTIDKSPQSENLATLPYIKNTQPPGPTASTASEVIPTSEQQAFTRFFDSQELDTSAEPQNNFSDALGRLLPLNVQAIMLEFWIEKDGTTAQVKCLDGACSQAVIASLPELSSLRFAPAVRDGHAVASRKVLQIDPPPSFGL